MIITLEIFTLNVSSRSAQICQEYYRDCNTRCLAVWIIRHVNLYIFERFMSLVCCCTSWITSLRISSYILKVLFTNKWYTHTHTHKCILQGSCLLLSRLVMIIVCFAQGLCHIDTSTLSNTIDVSRKTCQEHVWVIFHPKTNYGLHKVTFSWQLNVSYPSHFSLSQCKKI